MNLSSFIVGREVEVQYQVFHSNKSSGLQWYKGTIAAVSMMEKDSAHVTIKFEKCDGFDSCLEHFTIESSDSLRQGGNAYPIRFSNSNCDDADKDEGKLIKESTLSSLESRISNLEKLNDERVCETYYQLCGLLSNKLRKYMCSTHRRPNACTTFGYSTGNIVVDMDCSLGQFDAFVQYLRVNWSHLTCCPSRSISSIPSNMSIELHSFLDLCSLFNISQSHYTDIVVKRKRNRHGSMSALKVIGTLLHNVADPTLPFLLCVGGNVQQWNESNVYLCREHSHQSNHGLYSANITKVKDGQCLSSHLQKHSEVQQQKLGISWNKTASTEICTSPTSKYMVIGKVSITIPFIQFSDMTLATSIDRCLKHFGGQYDSDCSSE